MLLLLTTKLIGSYPISKIKSEEFLPADLMISVDSPSSRTKDKHLLKQIEFILLDIRIKCLLVLKKLTGARKGKKMSTTDVTEFNENTPLLGTRSYDDDQRSFVCNPSLWAIMFVFIIGSSIGVYLLASEGKSYFYSYIMVLITNYIFRQRLASIDTLLFNTSVFVGLTITSQWSSILKQLNDQVCFGT